MPVEGGKKKHHHKSKKKSSSSAKAKSSKSIENASKELENQTELLSIPKKQNKSRLKNDDDSGDESPTDATVNTWSDNDAKPNIENFHESNAEFVFRVVVMVNYVF